MVEVSSLDVLFLARELGRLHDAYVDKVYEVSPGEFLIRTRHPHHGKQSIVIRPGAFACLTEEPPETPQSPTSFAALLRKHLVSNRIRRVEQQEFDRVLVFHVDQHGEPLRLIVELFGKGNLLIVGPDEIIRVVQRTETFKDRTLKLGQPFKFPPSRVNPARLSREQFESLADKTERDAVRFLATDLGYGPDLAEELLHRAKVNKNRKARELTQGERDEIWKQWQQILHGDPQPHVARRDTAARPESIRFEGAKFAGWTREPAKSVSDAIDQARQLDVAQAPEPVDEERARLERQLKGQEESIAELEKESAAWNQRATHLYAHYADAQAAHQAAAQFVKEHDWSGAEKLSRQGQAPPPIVRVLAEPRKVEVTIVDQVASLDPGLSLERNASGFFDESKRVKEKIENAKKAVEETRKQLATREKAAAQPKPAARMKAPDKRFWFESFRWFYTSDGFLVVGGRDAASNEKAVKKHLNAGDLYFHADIHGAPSCVLKTEGKPPTETSIRQAAQFAAAYSKAFAQFGSADAYWVRPEQVSKTAESGEFVGRGAFIVRGERAYVPKLPMEIAVGPILLAKDGRPAPDGAFRRLVGGPREALVAWAEKPVIVVRGDRKVAEVTRDLATRFGVSHDEVQAVLPPGTLRILGEAGA